MTSFYLKIAGLSAFFLMSVMVNAAPTILSFDGYHATLDSDKDLQRLQSYRMTISNAWNVDVAEGFFVQDTDHSATWAAIGESGKFHASRDQSLDVSKTLLLTSSFKTTYGAESNTKFRFCNVSLSLEKTNSRPAKANVSFSKDVSKYIDGSYQSVRERFNETYDIPVKGSFIDINLSSQLVYDVVIHATGSDGSPVIMVIDHILLERSNRLCG